jgi:hypothetical protein
VRKVGYVAIDHGPRLALEALKSHIPGPWLKASGDDWTMDLRAQDVELLVCGTSDSAQGREAEAGAQSAAHALGTPTVVVEDFPGNFASMPATLPRLLCVESEFAAALARRKMPALAVHVGPAIRYDALRRQLSALRLPDGKQAENAVLWIGQPETADALRTLGALLPSLQARGSPFWFRSHPRDAGYAGGAYAEILDRSRQAAEDVTSISVDECLRRRPRLVITQFSSVAVEAGFWGIPSLNVLLPGAGGSRLAQKKGYSVPPWCEEGAAFLIARPDDVDKVLDRALESAEARSRVMQAFDRYFKVAEEGTPALINLLYNQGLL